MGGRTSPKVRVLLVDDLPDIRLVMRLLLEADGRVEVVGEAAEGSEGVRLAGELHPDAVVLSQSGRTLAIINGDGLLEVVDMLLVISLRPVNELERRARMAFKR